MRDDPPTHLRIGAALRLCSARGAFAAILHKGDAERGVIIQKLRRFDGTCRLLTESRDAEGQRAWFAPLGETPDEAAIERYIARAINRDEDAWVIEIEGPADWSPFEDIESISRRSGPAL